MVNYKQIAKELNIVPEDLINNGTMAFLEKELRLAEADIADIRERYGVLSKEELEKKIKKGAIPAHPAWEDLIQWENLEEHKKRIASILTELDAYSPESAI